MLSRVADAVYWMARYLERAESTARSVDVNLQMGLDAPIAFSDQWQPLVAITGDLGAFSERYGAATRENVIQFLTFDAENPNSILTSLSRARENARSVREVISSETWEQLNRYYLMVSNRAATRRALDHSYSFYADVRLYSYLIAGAADTTMSRGEAWHFMQLGRLIERADNITRLLDVKYFLLLPSHAEVGGPIDEMEWSAVLRSATALEMYRKKHGRLTASQVVDFLLLDTEFPRAVLFCLIAAEASLRAITGSLPGTYHNLAERRLGQLRAELAYAQVSDIIAAGLHEYLDGLQQRLIRVGEAIRETFFGPPPADAVEAPALSGGLTE